MPGPGLQDVATLKDQWVRDPCWDIEDTEGFEDVRDELVEFRAKQEARWGQERREAIRGYRERGLDDTALEFARGNYFVSDRIRLAHVEAIQEQTEVQKRIAVALEKLTKLTEVKPWEK